MAFTTQRGRPRNPISRRDIDPGTPELRLKHALRITVEPIDLCLEKNFITVGQHWCGLHLRWLYTLRYGAPQLTAFYADHDGVPVAAKTEDPDWRAMREREYHDAVQLLRHARRYECVMRLAVFNEPPAFLNHALHTRALERPALAQELRRVQVQLAEGLDVLAHHWRLPGKTGGAPSPQPRTDS